MKLLKNIFGQVIAARVNAAILMDNGVWHNGVKFATLDQEEIDFIKRQLPNDDKILVEVEYDYGPNVKILKCRKAMIPVRDTEQYIANFRNDFGLQRYGGFHQPVKLIIRPNGMISQNDYPLGYVEYCPFRKDGRRYIVTGWLSGGNIDEPYKLAIDPFTLIES